MTEAVPTFPPAPYSLAEPAAGLREFLPGVRAILGDPGHALVDVRSPAEFSGAISAPPEYQNEGAQRAATSRVRSTSPGPRRSRTTTPSSRRSSSVSSTRAGGSPPTSGSSPTAGSASARRTPGSCSPICSATRGSPTTTARGANGATRSAFRSRERREVPRRRLRPAVSPDPAPDGDCLAAARLRSGRTPTIMEPRRLDLTPRTTTAGTALWAGAPRLREPGTRGPPRGGDQGGRAGLRHPGLEPEGRG